MKPLTRQPVQIDTLRQVAADALETLGRETVAADPAAAARVAVEVALESGEIYAHDLSERQRAAQIIHRYLIEFAR